MISLFFEKLRLLFGQVNTALNVKQMAEITNKKAPDFSGAHRSKWGRADQNL
jgi:hypothetical protein